MIGKTLAHYRVISKLGSGGTGDVYLARDTVLNRSVALKMLVSDMGDAQNRLRRFVEEAKAASALNHPSIATVHQLGEAAGIHFIVMEYVEGSTLKTKTATGPFEVSELIQVAIQIAHALEAAHSIGILHRDIKSSNIMITPRGHVKVLDFGIAKRMIHDELSSGDLTQDATQPGVVMGTVAYMSPEQALGQPLDRRTDLFSLGVVLYEMATGCLPFSGSTPFETIDNILHQDPRRITSLNSSIPAGVERIIDRCLEKRIALRVQTAGELANDLQSWQTQPLTVVSADRSRTNLPQQLTRFIGRQREMAEIRNLWTETRLITLSGPGGIGKTRLALQIAGESVTKYDDGTWFVDLASVVDADLVPHTVAKSLGIRDEGGRSIEDSLVGYLESRRLLLVLDNCEHLIRACAQLTDRLLRSAENLHVLATSREALAIAGETVFRVSSLGLPDPHRLPDVDSLRRHEAVELFLDRAHAVKPSFAISSDIALPLATLCVQLDGIPLAIELAASRVRVLSVAQIADRLNDRLSLLTGGSRTALPRHQTLLAAIEWSYHLLSDAEKILFRRLSVFAGGWTLEAAEAVCARDGIAQQSVLELLAGLVDKSLVLVEERAGQTRYRFMVTLLEYARKQLLQTAEGDAINRSHAEFVVALADQGEAKLRSSEQKEWLERLTIEYDNTRAALAWTSTHDVEMALHLAGALGRFWYLRGYWEEARKWLAEILDAPAALALGTQRVRALNASAVIAENLGEHETARTFSLEALRLSRESGNAREAGIALNSLAVVAGKQDDIPAARSLLQESLTIRRQLGDNAYIGITLANLGVLAMRQSDFASARSFYEESLKIAKDVDHKHGIATTLLNLGDVARRMGEYASARELLDRGLRLAQDLGDRALIPIALNSLGDMAGLQGDRAKARTLLTDGLEVARELGDKRLISDLLLSIGVVAEDDARARAMFEESLEIRRKLGARREIAIALNCLGSVAARDDEYARAASLYDESLAVSRQSGAKDATAQSLAGLADVARLRGDHVHALSLYKQSLTMWRDSGEKPELLRPLEQFASLLTTCGQHRRAVRMWGAAQACRDALPVPRSPADAADYEYHVNAARAALTVEDFATMWEQGQTISPEEAIADALQDHTVTSR